MFAQVQHLAFSIPVNNAKLAFTNTEKLFIEIL
jgi:hypothetical protein